MNTRHVNRFRLIVAPDAAMTFACFTAVLQENLEPWPFSLVGKPT